MNSSYMNMIAGCFLGTVFVLMSVSLISDVIFHVENPEQAGFVIEVPEQIAGETDEEAVIVAATPIAVLLASADANAGESAFRKCSACHTVDEGGANRVGPNLWDIVNKPMAASDGFGYSNAMTDYSQDQTVVWDYEHLNGFLENPKSYMPGTAMSFAGLKKEDERANVIAYLRSLSANPAPLSNPEEATQ